MLALVWCLLNDKQSWLPGNIFHVQGENSKSIFLPVCFWYLRKGERCERMVKKMYRELALILAGTGK